MNDQLFVCFTPLQLLIAKNIVITEKFSNSKILIIKLSDNKKLDFYLEKNQHLFNNQVRIFRPQGKFKFLKLLSLLKFIILNFNFLKVDTLFIASLHDRFAQIIISLLQPRYLITFDDGIANLYRESIFFTSKIIKSLILNKALCHYTIFPNMDNILPYDKLKFVQLLESKDSNISVTNAGRRIVKIFLGQPYDEMSGCISEENIIAILKKLNIDFYLRHPREKVLGQILNITEIINTDLIIEDYLSIYLKNNENDLIELYSLNSTALITTTSFDRVKTYAIANKCLNESYRSIYEIFEYLGIPILKVN